MDVKKININQSESTYYIASDIYDVTARNNGTVFESLSSLLGSDNLSTLIPTSIRCGGMTIRFVQSSDSKYVQYRLMGDTFSTTESDWQGVDDVPTNGSDNLIKSGGVASAINDIDASTQAIAKIASKSSRKLEKIKISEDKEYIYKISEKDNLRFGVLGDDKGIKIEKIKHRTISDENFILKVSRGGIDILSVIPLDGINGIVGARCINNALPNFELKKDFQMTDGDIVYMPYTLSYADVTYSCNFTFENNFGTFTLGRGYNPNGNTIKHTTNAGWLEITSDKIYEKVRQFAFSDYPHTYKEYLHGLNLKSPISIIVQTRIGKGSIYESFITITNGDGKTFTIDKTGGNSDQRGITSSVGTTYIKCDSMDIHVNSFSFSNARLKKEVWLYGDSYFGAYWRYLIGKGYGIDSYGQMFAGGENSESAINSLKFDIKHGCPRYILYGMGMNDGNDTELVNPTWKKNTEEFLDICDRYNISVTMLTVPNVRYEGVLKEDHRKLNEYIRNSGRHYIDVAAMMEDGDGNWYEGLISDTPAGDIHPSSRGSAIIAAAILSAFPQLSNEKFNI